MKTFKTLKIKFWLWLLFSFLVFVTPLWAATVTQLSELSIYPYNINYGARPLGMGSAFIALPNDAYAVLYNPGGLAWAKGVSLSLSDLNNFGIVQAHPTGNNASLGLGVITTKVVDVPITTGEATSTSNLVLVSYGSRLSALPGQKENNILQRLGAGLSLKVLVGETLRRTSQNDESASGWELDFGLLYWIRDWWSVGLVMENFMGSGLTWADNDVEAVPSALKLGTSLCLIGDLGSPIYREKEKLLIAGEIDYPLSSQPSLIRLATEWNLSNKYYLRTGYMQQYKGVSGISSDINFGVGYRLDNWAIDLARYLEVAKSESRYCLSITYLPPAWVVVEKLDIERPQLSLEDAFETLSLKDDVLTYDDKIDITGKVKPGVSVFINGRRALVADDGTFVTQVPLHMKKNLVVVEARYDGEKKVWKYKVLRKAKVKIINEEKVENLEEKKEKIEELVTLGVVEVEPEEEIDLEEAVKRGELCTWLVKAANMRLPEVSRDLFLDVPKDHPLAPYIKAIVDLKLLSPFPDGTFRPNAPVTKKEGDAIFEYFGVTK